MAKNPAGAGLGKRHHLLIVLRCRGRRCGDALHKQDGDTAGRRHG